MPYICIYIYIYTYSRVLTEWYRFWRLFLKPFQPTRIQPMGFTISTKEERGTNHKSHENLGTPGTKLNFFKDSLKILCHPVCHRLCMMLTHTHTSSATASTHTNTHRPQLPAAPCFAPPARAKWSGNCATRYLHLPVAVIDSSSTVSRQFSTAHDWSQPP